MTNRPDYELVFGDDTVSYSNVREGREFGFSAGYRFNGGWSVGRWSSRDVPEGTPLDLLEDFADQERSETLLDFDAAVEWLHGRGLPINHAAHLLRQSAKQCLDSVKLRSWLDQPL